MARSEPGSTTAPLTAATPAPVLTRLATHPDPRVRAQVAAHPNTPGAVLGTLAADYPREVLGNPALPLLRLADPHLLRGWPDSAFHALLHLPQLPDWVRAHLLRRGAVELLIPLAPRRDLSLPEITALAAHPAWLVRARVAARPELPLAVLATLSTDADYGVRLAVASRPDLPAATAEALRQDPSRFVRQVAGQRRPG